MKNDFTTEDGALSFLSSFWTSAFPDTGFVRGLSASYALETAQAYQEAVEIINSCSVSETPLHSLELTTPLILNESEMGVGPLPITYGSGIVYGDQPSDSIYREGEIFEFGGKEKLSPFYYFALPENVVSIGSTVVNRLVNPSEVLIADQDFLVVDSRVIAFDRNPFEGGTFPIRAAGDDRQIVAWLSSVQSDKNLLYRRHGYPFFTNPASSIELREACKTLFALYTGGPSQLMIDAFVAANARQPVIAEIEEVIEEVEPFGDEIVIVTDRSVYRVASDCPLRAQVKVGARMRAGTPLTEVTQVDDLISNPKWWESEAGITLGRGLQHPDFYKGPLFIPNTEVRATPVEVDGGEMSAEFEIFGSEEAVESFWEKVHQGSPESKFLGTELWKRRGITDSNGDPDFDSPVVLNPMGFVVEDLLGVSLVGVRVQADKLDDPVEFLENMKNLHRGLTPISLLIFFIDYSVSEEYDLSDTAEAPTAALGAGIYRDEVDFTTFVEETVSVKSVISC